MIERTGRRARGAPRAPRTPRTPRTRGARILWAGGGAAAAGAGWFGASTLRRRFLRDPARRVRIERTVRVWRLTVRRGLHFAAIKVRGARLEAEERAALEATFAIRTAEDVAKELGNMKGALMKLGQLVGFIAEGLPEEAQRALASLQADAPAMAPSLAASVVVDEFGAPPERLLLDWEAVPVAAASIGQVHRGVLHDGREVAVKIQYPGIEHAVRSDLANSELLYGLLAAVSLRGVDVPALVEELRGRMFEELDYRLEASNQADLAARFAGHPFVRIPAVVPELSAQRVLTTEWASGWRWAELEAKAPAWTKQVVAEVLFRFAQRCVHHLRVFNADPHPGNYRFHPDGTVTFLDFGLVKRWADGEWERLSPCLDAIVIERDPEATVAAMERAGFLREGHNLDPQRVYEYVSAPYRPFLADEFRFDRTVTAEAIAKVIDVNGPYADVIRTLDMPPSFLMLDRVTWGISALMGKLGAEGPWRAILLEYRRGDPPSTELGLREAAWVEQSTSPGTRWTP